MKNSNKIGIFYFYTHMKMLKKTYQYMILV